MITMLGSGAGACAVVHTAVVAAISAAARSVLSIEVILASGPVDPTRARSRRSSAPMPPARNKWWDFTLILAVVVAEAIDELSLLEGNHHESDRHCQQHHDVQTEIVDEQQSGDHADAGAHVPRLTDDTIDALLQQCAGLRSARSQLWNPDQRRDVEVLPVPRLEREHRAREDERATDQDPVRPEIRTEPPASNTEKRRA